MLPLLFGVALASDVSAQPPPTNAELAARVVALEAEVAAFRDDTTASTVGESVVVQAGTRVEEAVGIGGPVEVFGTVSGDVVSLGDDIYVHPGGSIEGDAVSLGGRVEVDEQASVTGNQVAFGDRVWGSVANVTDLHAVPFLEGIARRLALILSFAAAGVMVVGMWPDRVRTVANRMRERPLWHAFSGSVLTGFLLLAIVLFSVTLIGIPVAVVLAMVLSIAWCMGFVAVCQATGDRFPGIQGRGAWPAFLLGTTLMAIVWMFPYVGPVVLTLLALPAAGAALTTRFGGTGRPPAASA